MPVSLDDCGIPPDLYEEVNDGLSAVISRASDSDERVARCKAMEAALCAVRIALTKGRRKLEYPDDPEQQPVFREMVAIIVNHSEERDNFTFTKRANEEFLETAIQS